MRDFRLAIDPGGPVPVWLAAINARMLRLAGAVADGVFLTWARPDEIPAKVAAVRQGAEEAGRDPDEVEVVCSFWGYAGPDVEQATAAAAARSCSATPPSRPTPRRSSRPFPALGEATAAWNAGDRAGALGLVPDASVHELCAVSEDGSASAAMAARFARRRASTCRAAADRRGRRRPRGPVLDASASPPPARPGPGRGLDGRRWPALWQYSNDRLVENGRHGRGGGCHDGERRRRSPARYDAVVIGAGAAGLTAAALLATEGKRVPLFERPPILGGRAMAADDEGFKVNLGGHLIEDSRLRA